MVAMAGTHATHVQPGRQIFHCVAGNVQARTAP